MGYENPKIEPVFAKLTDLAIFSKLNNLDIKFLNEMWPICIDRQVISLHMVSSFRDMKILKFSQFLQKWLI